MKRLTLILLVISTAAFATDTTRFVIISAGKIAGKQITWSDGQGKIHYRYEYNDRGRGPKLQVDLQLENGQVVSRRITGVDYYKGPVDEVYELKDGVAKWKNKVENEQRNVTGPVIYSPLEGVPGEIEWTLKQLLRQKGHVHEMDMLPSGKLKATHVKSHKALVNTFEEELELYAFSGFGGPPSYVWVTPNKAFFASLSGWMSTIKLGYEFLIPELKKLQDRIEEEYFAIQEDQLTHRNEISVAFTHVNVFDSKSGKVLADQTVVVEGGKITQVGKAKSVKIPAGAREVAGQGKMLMPGLWDNHAHYGMAQGLYHLAGGVTNIKDMANELNLPDMRKKVDTDILLGPDISVMSGFIDFAGPYAGPTGKIVKTLEEGMAAVNYYADNGYQQIKLYSSIPVEWVKPLAAEAHRRGLKVVGHIPSFMTAERAVNDGYDEIIHMNMIMLNFMGDTVDTRSMGRFIKVAERARNINVNGPEVKRFVKLLKDKKVVVDPTMAIFESMFTNEPGKLAAGYETTLNMLPPEFRRSLYTGGLPTMKGHEAEYKQSFDNMLKMLKVLHANGIPFLPGTDDFPGFALHRELELYAKAGVPNKEVLQKATIQSARVAGKEGELGSVEVGKKANLILVEGNPVKNISDIRKVEFTMKGGHLYDAKSLYASYGFGFWK
ncbi:MAG: amidohydrolase family protein [Cyclobacteriaceae bacterium]|nr:amidohydrolase family protein [Cyclobacteriaceae bacterium]